MDCNTTAGREGYHVTKFHGKSTHAEHFLPHTSLKPMSNIFRPFARPFEPWRLPFEAQSVNSTAYCKQAVAGSTRPYIGAWARRDGSGAIGSRDPLDVLTSYGSDYRNPSFNSSLLHRYPTCLSRQEMTRPGTSDTNQAQVEEIEDIPNKQPNSTDQVFTANYTIRSLTSPPEPHSFKQYKAVSFQGNPYFSSEYTGSYRDFSRAQAYCNRLSRDKASIITCSAPPQI